jgi:protein SCO1/2
MRAHRSLRPVLGALIAMTVGVAGCGAPATSRTAHAVRASHADGVLADAAPARPAAGREDAYSLYDLPSTWHDQHGTRLRLPALAGRVRVVAMVYTSCHATCPLIVADLKRIESSIPAARRDAVGFVLVSLDPARDTPGQLAAWAARTQLDSARWTLLNGDAEAVREVAAALGVRYQPQADDELAHTNAITVLDPTGIVVHQQVGLGAQASGTIDAVRLAIR